MGEILQNNPFFEEPQIIQDIHDFAKQEDMVPFAGGQHIL